MLDILVGFTTFSVSRPLTIAGGADDWVPCLVRPVPSPVRKKTTDSARRMSNEFFVVGMGCGTGELQSLDWPTFILRVVDSDRCNFHGDIHRSVRGTATKITF